ncbi:MAG: hypothetical protein WEF50_22855 [Myxococcota bacterium]
MSDGDGENDGVAVEEIAPGEEIHLVRSAQLDWIHALAERLAELGIPRQVNPIDQRRATDSTWGLYVRPSDLPRAQAVDREVMLELMPDLPEDFDPSALDTSQCPACGDSVAEGSSECAGCGLALL